MLTIYWLFDEPIRRGIHKRIPFLGLGWLGPKTYNRITTNPTPIQLLVVVVISLTHLTFLYL